MVASVITGSSYSRVGRWILSSSENGVTVQSPYHVRELSVDYGANATSIGSSLDAERSAQRRASEPRSVSFAATWRAEHSADDIRPHRRSIERLFEHDPGLGRVPRVLFEWAGIETLEGLITSLQIEWTDGVFPTPPYLPRAFMADLTIERQQRRQFEAGTRFQRETTQRRVGSGEDFEHLAWRQYGDPYLGIMLRRTNPEISQFGLRPGDVVRMLDETHPRMRESVEPASPALLGDVEELLQSFAEERLALSGAVGVEALWEELGL